MTKQHPIDNTVDQPTLMQKVIGGFVNNMRELIVHSIMWALALVMVFGFPDFLADKKARVLVTVMAYTYPFLAVGEHLFNYWRKKRNVDKDNLN